MRLKKHMNEIWSAKPTESARHISGEITWKLGKVKYGKGDEQERDLIFTVEQDNDVFVDYVLRLYTDGYNEGVALKHIGKKKAGEISLVGKKVEFQNMDVAVSSPWKEGTKEYYIEAYGKGGREIFVVYVEKKTGVSAINFIVQNDLQDIF